MALIDDPKAWILKMFEKEEREGRGETCQRFPNGIVPEGVPLEPGEKVYGIYKSKYFFSPLSFITKAPKGFNRTRWDSIVNCSSQHGEGKKTAKLTLTDGSVVAVRVGDFATGWSGRISQLFHQMIQKWGANATLGPQPYSIEKFFNTANDDYCIAPNLEPHFTLQELRESLNELRNHKDVIEVLIHILEIEEGIPASDGIIIRTKNPEIDLNDFKNKYSADFITDAPDEIVRGFPSDNYFTKMIIWD